MRRLVIRYILPTLFCLSPIGAAALLFLALPPRAVEFYLGCLRNSYLDWVILILGTTFFAIQLLLSWRALQWHDQQFDDSAGDLLQRISQATEWFPLLGLLGTVAGILQTFAAIGVQESVAQKDIIRLYAPALTTTGSGLVMALLNLVPWWVVSVGRRIILSLALVPYAGPRGN